MKKLLLLIMAMIITATQSFAADIKTIDLVSLTETSKDVSLEPQYKVKQNGDTLDVQLSFRYISISTDDSDICQILIPGYDNIAQPMEPQLLAKSLRFPLKDGHCVKLEILNQNSVEIPMKLAITPQNPDIHDAYVLHSSKNDKLVPNTYHPIDPIAINPPQYYRGYGYITLDIMPIQYDHESHFVRINNNLHFRIIYTDDTTNSKKISDSLQSICKLNIAPDDNFLERYVYANNGLPDNYKIHGLTQRIGEIHPKPTQYTYLIITTTDMREAAEKLADWKALLGYNVKIISKSANWTSTQIKSRISSTAESYPNLYYVLLLGDATKIPGECFPHPETLIRDFTSDFHYYCLDGDNDYVPDVYGGRIPCSTLETANTVIEKIISYEKNPVMSKSFYKSSFHANEFISDSYGSENGMHTYATETATIGMQKYCGFNVNRIYAANKKVNPISWDPRHAKDSKMPDYLKRPDFEWDGSSEDIINSINNGVLYGLYRGHGSYTQWGSHIKLLSEDIKGMLTNEGKYPIIFAITCQSGGFDKNKWCMANEFLTAKGAGAVGVIAPTEIEYSLYSDGLLGAILRHIWPQSGIETFSRSGFGSHNKDVLDSHLNVINSNSTPESHLGKILNLAIADVEMFYPIEKKPTTILTKRLFHCFGDPALEIKTSLPGTFRDISVIKEKDGFVITGDYTRYDGGAQICVVDNFGNKILCLESLRNMKVETLHPDRCTICISGRKMKPLVIAGSEGYSSIPVIANYPNCENETYIDFTTGERVTKAFDPAIEDYEVSSSDNGLIEITISGAYVFTDNELIPEKEHWYIGGAKGTYVSNKPTVSIIPIKFPLMLDDDENNFSLIDTDYIEFDKVDCMPNYLGVGTLDGPDTHFETIEPYSGYWPEEVIWSINSTGHKPQHIADRYVQVALAPCQYDYENKVMRVHRKIRLQRNIKNSEVDNIERVTLPTTYYSIDGMKIDNPQKGQIYIRKIGDQHSKIVF